MMTARINGLTLGVLGVGVAATFLLMAFAGDQEGRGPVRLLMYPWTALPYAVLALTTRFLARTPARQMLALAGAAGVAFAGVGLLLDAYVFRPDPQAAVTLLLLPAYQLVLAVAVLLVEGVLTLRRPVPPIV
jgi:hypothetical protein